MNQKEKRLLLHVVNTRLLDVSVSGATLNLDTGEHTEPPHTMAEVNRFLSEGSDYKKGWMACRAAIVGYVEGLLDNPNVLYTNFRRDMDKADREREERIARGG